MRFNKLDLNLLVALDALLSEASISRAAVKLNLSQSAASSALARLREFFGDQLLVPVSRHMELTPRAETLRAAVRDVLTRVDSTITAEPTFDPALSDRRFRILASDYTLATVAPHLLALAYESSKTVSFQFLTQVVMPHRMIERNEADLVLFPQEYCSEDHPSETVWADEFVCVVCSQSSHVKTPLTLERFMEAGHVVMQQPGDLAAFDSMFLARHGFSRRVEVSTYSFSSLPPLVMHTERIATVQHRLVKLAQQSLKLTALPCPLLIPKMNQCMQWHQYRSADPAITWLRNLMLQAAERMDKVMQSTK